jgi:hypothetical protein
MGIFRTRAKKELPAIFPNAAKVEKEGVSELDKSVSNLKKVIDGLEGGKSLAVDKKSQGNEPRFKSKKNSLLWNFLRIFVGRKSLTNAYYKVFKDKRKPNAERITSGLKKLNGELESLKEALSSKDPGEAKTQYVSLGVAKLVETVTELTFDDDSSNSGGSKTVEHRIRKYLHSHDNQHIEDLIKELKNLQGLCKELQDTYTKAAEPSGQSQDNKQDTLADRDSDLHLKDETPVSGNLSEIKEQQNVDASDQNKDTNLTSIAPQKESAEKQANRDELFATEADKLRQASIEEDKKKAENAGVVQKRLAQIREKEERQRNIQDLRSAYSELELKDDESVFGTLFEEEEASATNTDHKQGADSAQRKESRIPAEAREKYDKTVTLKNQQKIRVLTEPQQVSDQKSRESANDKADKIMALKGKAPELFDSLFKLALYMVNQGQEYFTDADRKRASAYLIGGATGRDLDKLPRDTGVRAREFIAAHTELI